MKSNGLVALAMAHVFACRGVAQPGRAPGSGPGGRRFKSSLPDQCSRCDLIHELPNGKSAGGALMDLKCEPFNTAPCRHAGDCLYLPPLTHSKRKHN